MLPLKHHKQNWDKEIKISSTHAINSRYCNLFPTEFRAINAI